MAGIGFRLQKILHQNSYRSLIEGYLYSALISTGPWLLSILGLALIGLLSGYFIETHESFLFRTAIIYCHIGSLVMTGAVQMGTTRYIADRLFLGDSDSLLPCYHWVAGVTLLGGGAVAGLFFAFSGLPIAAAVGAVVVFQSVSLVWTGMTFLSAAKDYMAIVRAFALGYGMATPLSLLGAMHFGVTGMVWGFALGMVLLAWLLSTRIKMEFPSRLAQDSTVYHHWTTMPLLLVIGFFYNAGIFVDKIIFWLGPFGERLADMFYYSPRYDTCIYLGYLSIVPAMSLFLIRIETAFYKQYAAFYTVVTQGGTLSAIKNAKQAMISAMQLSVSRLLTLQGTFSLALILLTPRILQALEVPADFAPLMRISLLAAFVQVMLLILMVILLYFDWQKEVAILSIGFFLSNGLFTAITLYLPENYHGFGYLSSCLISLCLGLHLMEYKINNLEYETFCKQPIRAG